MLETPDRLTPWKDHEIWTEKYHLERGCDGNSLQTETNAKRNAGAKDTYNTHGLRNTAKAFDYVLHN